MALDWLHKDVRHFNDSWKCATLKFFFCQGESSLSWNKRLYFNVVPGMEDFV
jgi:hypothetical protein